MTSYNERRRLRQGRQAWSQKFKGGGDHFGNFIDAVRSRKHEDLNADILEGHLSSALCHLANISYRLGEQAADGRSEGAAARATSDTAETFDRFVVAPVGQQGRTAKDASRLRRRR